MIPIPLHLIMCLITIQILRQALFVLSLHVPLCPSVCAFAKYSDFKGVEHRVCGPDMGTRGSIPRMNLVNDGNVSITVPLFQGHSERGINDFSSFAAPLQFVQLVSSDCLKH